MTKEKKTSGGRAPGEREAHDEKARDEAAPASTMSKHGGLIVPLVVFGLIALAVLVDLLMS